jgi:hypothetical protein
MQIKTARILSALKNAKYRGDFIRFYAAHIARRAMAQFVNSFSCAAIRIQTACPRR